uniref:Cytochrome P450 6PZ20 n=1 Tax=Maconellicoccus hirsutus TaxID=177089 RepID=A0AAT9UTK5_MACHI
MDIQMSVILLIISIFLYLYWYLRKVYSFFEHLNIPYLEPNLLFGNMTDVFLLRKSLAEIYLEMYRKLEPHRYAGVFNSIKPTIIIRDPDLLKDVLIKDFAFFNDRGFDVMKDLEPLSNHLFLMKGDEWKNLRIKLTSTFTTGKMKMMFPLVNECATKLSQVIGQIPLNQSFDIKDLSSRYTTDVIASCAFGLMSNSLDNPNSEFRQTGKKLLEFRFASVLRSLKINLPKKLMKLLNLTIMDLKTQNYFGDIVYKTVEYRERNNVTRNDFLDLLIALKNNSTSKKYHENDSEDLQKFLDQVGDKGVKSDIQLTNELLAAQALLFFIAGFETSSTALGYVLMELSLNQSIQRKVRQEIIDVLSSNDNQISYDVLKKMTYTDMVISESLRKHPPLSLLIRKTCENYKIPKTEVIIPSGTSIIIPVYGLHLDEKYYDNPQEFRPERFTEEEISKRSSYTYLPFGAGPRVCIASRFGKMTVKVGLVNALRNFTYRLSPEMKFPLKFEKNFGLLTPCNSILLQRQKIDE